MKTFVQESSYASLKAAMINSMEEFFGEAAVSICGNPIIDLFQVFQLSPERATYRNPENTYSNPKTPKSDSKHPKSDILS